MIAVGTPSVMICLNALRFPSFAWTGHCYLLRLMGLNGLWKIDLSGASLLLKEIRRARQAGADFHIFTTNAASFSVLRRLNVFAELGESNLHNNKAEAIAAAVANADDNICRQCELHVFVECAGKPSEAGPWE